MSNAQRDLPGLSVPDLEAFLGQALPGLLAGPLTAELVAGGRSNLTYVLSDGTSRWVLRRPPLGSVAETAHDMGREHRLLVALHPTAVPVPRPLVLAGPGGPAARRSTSWPSPTGWCCASGRSSRP